MDRRRKAINKRRLLNEIKETSACFYFCLEHTSNNLGVCPAQGHIPVFLRRVRSNRVCSTMRKYDEIHGAYGYIEGCLDDR